MDVTFQLNPQSLSLRQTDTYSKKIQSHYKWTERKINENHDSSTEAYKYKPG